jgi:hypothetical protein
VQAHRSREPGCGQELRRGPQRQVARIDRNSGDLARERERHRAAPRGDLEIDRVGQVERHEDAREPW